MARATGRTRRAAAASAVLLVGFAAFADRPAGYARPCPPSGDVVAVFSRTHELYLCRDGVSQARILVALGRGGVGKRRWGDGRTPLGTYAFGEPRPSRRYRTFIPITYPTPEQVAQGFTGGGIGIHGPPRGWKDPVAAAAFDWTRGCVATGRDREIEQVAQFVQEHKPVAVIR